MKLVLSPARIQTPAYGVVRETFYWHYVDFVLINVQFSLTDKIPQRYIKDFLNETM